MIDIHCHILYGVDDGASSPEVSKGMLEDMARQGVRGIIATPHYRLRMFSYPRERIDKAYGFLKDFAVELGIRLYVGCEYHVDEDIYRNLEEGRVHTMAGTNYVLCEYSYSDDLSRIVEYTQELVMRGYSPIVAHAERCGVFQRRPGLVREVIDVGAQIQVNADSVLGREGRPQKKLTRTLLEWDLVDYIASDAHDLSGRTCHLKECRSYVERRFGRERAEMLLIGNAERMLDKEVLNN